MRRIFFLTCFSFCIAASGQLNFNLASDGSVLLNMNRNQKFLTIGQSLQGIFHLTPKQSAYISIAYYQPGRFKNGFTSNAVLPLTTPQSLAYKIRSKWTYHQFSVGWKHYVIGTDETEDAISYYTIAGLGLNFNKVENLLDRFVDSTSYRLPPQPALGKAKLKRLTVDVGAGADIPLTTGVYLYAQASSWISASNEPSPALYHSKNVPFALILHFGIRVNFSNDY